MDSCSFPCDQNLSSVVAFGEDQIGSIVSWELKHQFIIDNQAFSEDHESKSGESGLIDLKINPQNLSSSTVCMASKRSEQKGLCSSAPLCKVYGCSKNLSNCKEYYKRHKVCEVHSKTSKVIVNGIEQRFCQQCSRFHLLREFDDGKRSCRKRLAGHNERRRKPHVGLLFERHGRLLPSYNISVGGNDFKESTGAISSFANPNDLHSPYDQRMQETNVRWNMNLEDRNAHDLQSTSCITSVNPCNFETDPRFINECIRASVSISESGHSLLSSQSGSNYCHSSRIQTSNSHPMFLDSHDLNPMVGFQDNNIVKFGIMYYDDQVVRDESCMINLLRLSSQLDTVEHQKGESQMNPSN